MSAFNRLPHFGAATERASLVWKSAVPQFGRGLQWSKRRPTVMFWAIGIGIAVFFLVFSGATAAGAALLGWSALRQAATANDRHRDQSNADRQRRITEIFSRAVEQLGSDKLEVRLGGIYSLEWLSKESPGFYWPAMETLTAFVRERSRRNEAERISQDFEQRVSRRAYLLWNASGRPDGRAEEFWAQSVMQDATEELPATDIAAVLAVIRRRSPRSRERERINAQRLDLSNAILRRADLQGLHLEKANLQGANLERATLAGAHLKEAMLFGAHLQGAFLAMAHLEGAILLGTHLDGAVLLGAHIEGTIFAAYGDPRTDAEGLSQVQLAGAYGDARTQLPAGLARPAHWLDSSAVPALPDLPVNDAV